MTRPHFNHGHDPGTLAMMSDTSVSLVIPGRNCARTIRKCLEAVVPLLKRPESPLAEILFVDDGSTDDTVKIVKTFPVACLAGDGKGPGSARNIGWRAAQYPRVWFVDSDCVVEPEALDLLLKHMVDPRLGGVSGSYGTMTADSLLSCLIHEEIIERHRSMSSRVNFLATFNVLYRRRILEDIGGFNEMYLKGQDAELSFRALAAGHTLGFEFNSRVRHYHPTRWSSYLATQRQQGHWRVWLHLHHRGHAMGDSYSSFIDHGQPPLAMLTLAASPLLVLDLYRWIPVGLVALLIAAQIPMTLRLLKRLRRPRFLCFAAMSFARAYWRGIGMTGGTIRYITKRLVAKE